MPTNNGTRQGAPPGLDKYQKQQQAIQLRAAGASYREIGQALDIDHTWARRIVLDGLNEAHSGNVEELRKEQGDRLERMLRGVYPAAVQGDHRSILSVLRILERQARLFGLDAPVLVQVSSEVDRQIEELASMLTIKGEVVTDDDGAGRASS